MRLISRYLPIVLLFALAPTVAAGQLGTGPSTPCTPYGSGDAVLEACRDAARRGTGSASAHRIYGFQLASRHLYKDAARAYKMATELEPNSADAHLGLAQAYDALGKKKQALQSYRRYVALQPDEPRGYQILGWLLLEMRRMDEALPVFRQAARLDPSQPAAHFGVGLALLGLHRDEEALLAFAQSVKLDAGDADVWGHMAVTASAMGRQSEALGYWEQAMKVSPAYFDSRPAERKVWEAAMRVSRPTVTSATVQDEVARRPASPARKRSIFAGPASSGSGFFVSRDGYVLTNKHVIRGCSAVKLKTDSSDARDAQIVALDTDDDLALLRAALKVPGVATFRNDPAVRAGDDVVAVGFPLSGLLADQVNVSVGTVNALAGLYNDLHMMQMSAPVQPGSSGGPLFDASGNIVGVVVTKLNAKVVAEETGDIPQNVNFAIKGAVARHFLEANGVKYQTGESAVHRSNADVGEIGRQVTVLVECHK
jgi:S1-C subfamily serine protease